jgi:hypothetical protein
VSRSLRQAGADRVLNRTGAAASEIALVHPDRSREWIKVSLLECHNCPSGRGPAVARPGALLGDALLLTVPNQVGVEYNAAFIESNLEYVAPDLGWR